MSMKIKPEAVASIRKMAAVCQGGMFGNRELFTRRDVSSASETGSAPSFRIRDGKKEAVEAWNRRAGR